MSREAQRRSSRRESRINARILVRLRRDFPDVYAGLRTKAREDVIEKEGRSAVWDAVFSEFKES